MSKREQKLLKSLVRYDERTGLFHYRPRPAGCPTPLGYVHFWFGGRVHGAHRLAVLYMTGRWPTDVVHHINGNRSDNRWSNLREATKSQNNHWKPTLNANGSRGVYKHFNKWVAQININRKRYYLGTFKTKEEAAAVYRETAAKHYLTAPTSTT